MTTETRYAVYVIHPETGQPAWFKAPGQGFTYDKAEAHLWTAEALAGQIQAALEDGGDWGTKLGEYPCRIRQVVVTSDPTDCPHCNGTGGDRERPQYMCTHCYGTGTMSLTEDA